MLKLIPYLQAACFSPNPAGQSCATCLYFQPVCNLEYDRLPIKYPFVVEVHENDHLNYRDLPVNVPGSCVFFRGVTLTGLDSSCSCGRYAMVPKERQFSDTALTDINDDGRPYTGPTLLAGF